MSELAVRIESLGKAYQISPSQASRPYRTIREEIMSWVGRPLVGPLSPAWETVWALKDVSFEVRQGEVLGIIGRNGAGKSTLLKILSRITEPTSGYAEVYGRVGSLLEVGTGFHPELTGRENIFLNGAVLGMRRAEIARRFDEIVSFAGVEKYIDTPVKRYSSGMYMRLAFSVAAHLDPEILVVDEVLAVGDAEFQKKCLGKMGEVAKSGRTVLFVSHNLLAVRNLTRRTVWLDNGQIRTVGSSAEVIEQYLSQGVEQFVYDVEDAPREFLGDMAVKFIRVELERHCEGRVSFGEDIRILLTVKSSVHASDIRFSYTVFSAAGVPVGSGFVLDRFALNSGETATFRLVMPAPSLAPGRYYHGFGVGKGDFSTGVSEHDVIIGCPHYEVSPVKDGKGAVSFWGDSWGHLVFKGARAECLNTER